MKAPSLMAPGKTYKAEWVILGCPRTAYFKALRTLKNGDIRGTYLDAGATRWVPLTVKAAHFSRYVETETTP